ncbi:hypothetical protein TNCV_2879941 [Trichonephila clavipes]|uniref:Uncharacterized protein n=1 Tax=Trichonephila clavipes TaxID=2585209 RepID=A0A8X6W2L4_TRICX|nr:hypothetical protein TNCV_2879941 [Trichonephila clavipes]
MKCYIFVEALVTCELASLTKLPDPANGSSFTQRVFSGTLGLELISHRPQVRDHNHYALRPLYRLLGLIHINYVVAQCPYGGLEWKLGEWGADSGVTSEIAWSVAPHGVLNVTHSL